MTSSRDRIARILSDGVSPPAKAEPPTAPRGDLRARLSALGLDRPLAGSPAAAPPPLDPDWFREALGDPRPLEVQVDCRVHTNAHGSFVEATRTYPLEAVHGRVQLARALEARVPMSRTAGGRAARDRLAVRDAVFLDTETTGLAGGTGTVAFLVGAGRIEDGAFVVRQYCMRDFPEEAALLAALREDIGDAPLVTFNGRSFDWPLLLTRFRLHRMEVGPRPHLDLLPPARRLWPDSLESHTLGRLEQGVLGLEREQDLPGWRIPRAFFDYMNDGRAGLIAHAFKHNEIDVVSMLALLGRMGEILRDPTSRADVTPRDQLGTARFLLDLGEAVKARRCLEHGIELAGNGDAAPLYRALGHLCRREGAFDEALAWWTRLARTAPVFDAEAFEQAAKLEEHRRRDYGAALRWTEEALDRVAKGSRTEEAFLHRERRLRRKLGRSEGSDR